MSITRRMQMKRLWNWDSSIHTMRLNNGGSIYDLWGNLLETNGLKILCLFQVWDTTRSTPEWKYGYANDPYTCKTNQQNTNLAIVEVCSVWWGVQLGSNKSRDQADRRWRRRSLRTFRFRRQSSATALQRIGSDDWNQNNTSHHLTSHHLTSPHFTSPHLTLHHLTSPHITSPHITSHHLTSPCITSHHLTSPHITSHHLTSPHITSHHSLHHITSHHLTSPHIT